MPRLWSPAPVPTLWLDPETMTGLDDDGRRVVLSRDAGLEDVLSLGLVRAHRSGGRVRVMLTGGYRPDPADWMLRTVPEWETAGHWIDASHGYHVAAWREVETRTLVQVRTTAEWWGADAGDDPQSARVAWHVLGQTLDAVTRHERTLMLSPGATGLQVWAASLRGALPDMPDTLAELLAETSGQHRIELLTAGGDRCTCEDCQPAPCSDTSAGRWTVVDGRWMYAACTRELGVGPGRAVTGAELADVLREQPYARGWVHVRAEVPSWWHQLGLLMARRREGGWHAPCRPGAIVDTWADTSEVALAGRYGWALEPVEGYLWETMSPGPLDTYTSRLVRARHLLDARHDDVGALASAAVRRVHLHGIGSMASRGRRLAHVVPSAWDVPADATVVMPLREDGDELVYWTERKLRPLRPELAVQVWGRARARVLGGRPGLPGALDVPADELVGVHGDALITRDVPAWAQPAAYGGLDDGAPGKLRVKGRLPRARKPPRTHRDRDAMVAVASQHATVGGPR